jgi:hypothetical protein
VETGKSILRKKVQEFETQLDEVLAVRSFDVERVVVDRAVQIAPEVRQEDTTIMYPIVQ